MNLLVVVLALAFLLQGCPTEQQPKQTAVAPAQPPLPRQVVRGCQRFVPFGPGIGYALDTKTGIACKALPSATLNVPLCLDLWNKYPDEGKPKSPFEKPKSPFE